MTIETIENPDESYNTEVVNEFNEEVDSAFSDTQSTDDNFEEYEIEYESIYFKYWFEGCEKIDDILERIDSLKQQFEEWKNEGYDLIEPVNTGYCSLYRKLK